MPTRPLAVVLFALIAVAGIGQADANADSPIVVTRLACGDSTANCDRSFHVSDIAAYVKIFETHADDSPSKGYLEKDLTLGRSDLRHRDVVHFDKAGNIIEIWSRYRRAIGDVSVWNKQTVPVHPNGTIKSVTLAVGSWYRGLRYPADATLKFDPSGSLVEDDWYPRIETYALAAYPEPGVPQWLGKPVSVGPITLPKGSHVNLGFKGRIDRASILEPFYVCGARQGSGKIGFVYSDDGSLEFLRLWLDADHTFDGLRVRKNAPLTLYADCGIQNSLLAETATVDGFSLVAGKRIKRFKNGKLMRGTLKDMATINGVQISAGVTLEFGAPGYLQHLSGEGSAKDGDRIYGASMLAFHVNGNIGWGKLMQSAVINGITYPAGAKMKFDRDGNLLLP